jgi:DNA-binding NarL/FixJ family response regulator
MASITLTPRELDVVRALSLGLMYKQVADKLFISERTVDGHMRNIFKRNPDVPNAVRLVLLAERDGLLEGVG